MSRERFHNAALVLAEVFAHEVGSTGDAHKAWTAVCAFAEQIYGHTLNINGSCEESARLARIEHLLERLVHLQTRDRILFAFHITQGGLPVVTLDPQHGFSDRKLLFEAFIGVAGPLDDAGNPTVVPDPARPLTVESSDASVGTEDGADFWHFAITTPSDTGAATITIKGDSRVEPVQFTFDYAPPTLDRINVAFGGLVPDA